MRRTYGQIARANIFTFYNNVLFAIGIGLLALDRVNDAVVSVGLGLLNAVISAFQEMRAKRKLDALRLLNRTEAIVLRDEIETSVAPEDIRIGDLVRLQGGEQVVVDGPIEGPGRVEVDESVLTGESAVVVKVAGDRVLSGSFIVSGEARQRAEAVGNATHAQAVTAAAQQWTVSRTPLQRQVDLIVRVVIAVVALMGLAILGQGSMEGLPLVRLVQISAVLSGLVPYGLFFLIAVAYATGAAAIARRDALVQQVNAVESLSNVDVVCTDKTGTLTTGRLQLHTLQSLGELPEAQIAVLLSQFAGGVSSPNLTATALAAAYPPEPPTDSDDLVRDEVPFSSARRWSAVALTGGDVLVLGAPQSLVAGDALSAAVNSFTGQGLRVLLFARAVDPAAELHDQADVPVLPELEPLALVVLRDELRPQVRETLASFADAGVELKVVSGDDPRTVGALAAQIGLSDPHPVSGPELAAMNPGQFDEAVAERSVFGRIAPEQKEQIVDSLIASGRYVAMIGDGVNDIRSLKRAHVGVAMQSGSAVARDVADVVLLNDSFAALPLARHEGQRIIGGISTSLKLFLSRVAVSMLIIVGVSILGLGFPYEPAQVALTLFTVGLPTVLLTLWARPQRPDPGLIADLARFVIPVAVVTGVFAVGLYATFSTLLSNAIKNGTMPLGAVLKFEELTGLARTDPTFAATAATAVAQTGMSMFTAFTAFVLIVFLEPPARFFRAWGPVRADKRPAVLAAALTLVFVVILYVPVTASYFELVQPGGFVMPIVGGLTVIWFFALRATLRYQLLDRVLGLPRTHSEPLPPVVRAVTIGSPDSAPDRVLVPLDDTPGTR